MVRLTAREHYIAHKMLAREFPQDCSMIRAFWWMCHGKSDNQERDYKITSRDFEMARIKAHYFNRGERAPGYGKNSWDAMSEEAKAERSRKISIKSKGRNPRDYMSEEAKKERDKKAGDSLRGGKRTPEQCLHISESLPDKHGENNPNYGHYWSQEQKDAMSRLKGKPVRITNLITGEVKEFPTAKCDECAKFLGLKTKQQSTSTVSRAVKKRDGLIRKRCPNSYGKFYNAFKIECLDNCK